MVLDEPERDPIGRPDGQRHEAPEDRRVEQSGVQVAEHPHLGDRVDEQRLEPARARRRPRPALRVGEDAQVARHQQREHDDRDQEEQRRQRVEAERARVI